MTKRALVLMVLAGALMAACAAPAPEEPLFGTPLPRPTVIVVTSAGPYFTTFDGPEDWLTGEGDASVGLVEEGAYVMRILEPETLAWTHQTRTFGDGIYEVEATFSGGSEASSYGLLFLGSNDLSFFFYAMVTGDGRYDVGLCEAGCETQTSLIDGFTLAPIISTGYQTNRLRVELSGGQLTFLVNGAPVSQFRGVEERRGLVGLIGESSQFGGLEVTFDNLSVVETASTPAPEAPLPTPLEEDPAQPETQP